MEPKTREETSIDRVTEFVLALVRSELNDPDIGADDNFLDVGGHSLVAAKVNASLVERFGKKIPLRVLFEETLGIACRTIETV